MKTLKYILLINIVGILSYSCTECKCDSEINFINHTNTRLFVNGGFAYPDTAVSSITGGGDYISPNSKQILANYWLAGLEESQGGRIMIFIFDYKSLRDSTSGKPDYQVTKRYDLSLEDLNRLNWTITYPPTEAMKDVKMWPAYGIE